MVLEPITTCTCMVGYKDPCLKLTLVKELELGIMERKGTSVFPWALQFLINNSYIFYEHSV